MAGTPREGERPEPIRFAELVEGWRRGPAAFPTSADLVRRYAAITGDDNPLFRDPEAARQGGFPGPVLPPGLAGVWARRAYIGDRPMLPGGVMAGQDLAFRAAHPVGAPLALSARVVRQDPADPKRRVLLACEARDPDGRLVAEVTIDARWPPDEAPR